MKEIGKVKFFNDDKGYGFISLENSSDLFFHITKVEGIRPKKGDSVEFSLTDSEKGPIATEVKVLL